MNASGRLNTCKSQGRRVLVFFETGARVSNAYMTCPEEGDSPGKLGVIRHSPLEFHDFNGKGVICFRMDVRMIS